MQDDSSVRRGGLEYENWYTWFFGMTEEQNDFNVYGE